MHFKRKKKSEVKFYELNNEEDNIVSEKEENESSNDNLRITKDELKILQTKESPKDTSIYLENDEKIAKDESEESNEPSSNEVNSNEENSNEEISDDDLSEIRNKTIAMFEHKENIETAKDNESKESESKDNESKDSNEEKVVSSTPTETIVEEEEIEIEVPVTSKKKSKKIEKPTAKVEEDITEKLVKEEIEKNTENVNEEHDGNLSYEELQLQFELLEEKNRNLARILKDLSVELKAAREESEKQFEVIGRLASEKQGLEQKITEISLKANKLEYDVEVRDDQLSAFKKLGNEAESIQSQISNYKETANAIGEELANKNQKLRDLQTQIKELEASNKTLNDELNKTKDEKEDLAIVVLQQKAKLDKQNTLDTLPEGVTESNLDYKALDRTLKSEIDDLGESLRAKDRVIVRQINEIKDLNDKISDKNNELEANQSRIDDLVDKMKKATLDNNSKQNFISPSSNGSLLGKVMNNELDLKLKNIVNFSREELISDEEISKLFEKVEDAVNNTKTDVQYVKQYKFEVLDGVEQALTEFINDCIRKEATAYDYIVAMNDFEYEKEKLINKYDETINSLTKKLKNATDEANRLKLTLYRETRVYEDGKSINEYRDENKRLSEKCQNLKDENDILLNENNDNAIKKLGNLIDKERIGNNETEKLLKNEINTLKSKLNEETEQLEKLNGEYFITEYAKQLERIDAYITKIENGEAELNSGLLDEYYKDAYEKFRKQTLIYQEEINKRDELLKVLLDDKSEEQGRMVEKDINGELSDDPDTKERIKHNDKVIEAIEDIFNNKIVKLELDPKKTLDKKILLEFKSKAKTLYDTMIRTINEKAKIFDEELSNTNAKNALILYNSDFTKMAKFYADEIGEAMLVHQSSTNDFSIILTSAKIAALSNEFACLVKYKQEKSQEKFTGIYRENGEYNDKINANFSGTLEDISGVRSELEIKLSDLSNQYANAVLSIDKQIEDTKFKIDELNNKLTGANNEDVKRISMEIDTKNKVLEYLEKEKNSEKLEDLYKQIKDVKLQLEAMDKIEKESKEVYMDRMKNESQVNRDMNEVNMDINNAYGIKAINEYLQNLNAIDYTYFQTMHNNDNKYAIEMENLKSNIDKINKQASYYRDLNILKDEYEKTANVMRTDYQQVRDYDELSIEVKYLEKQVNFFTNEIEKGKEKIRLGVEENNSKDSIVMYQAKLLNLNEKLEKERIELDEMKSYTIVAQYVNTIEKISRLTEIIKEKGKEIK